MTKLIIAHDAVGKIIAMGEVESGPPKGIYATLVPSPEQSLLEVEKTGELQTKNLEHIAREYLVDLR